MTEKEWVKSIIQEIELELPNLNNDIRVVDGHRLSYSNEILSYDSENKPDKNNLVAYETDILIYEQLNDSIWKPRVIVETKLGSVTTHDAITYSQKAQTHKFVHPYSRYGILIGDRENYPLPGRLFRHGQHFDFMVSWKSIKADSNELEIIIKILDDEIKASKTLDEILYNSRMKTRKRFTTLHRPLRLSK